jgi:hypothetical protein
VNLSVNFVKPKAAAAWGIAGEIPVIQQANRERLDDQPT